MYPIRVRPDRDVFRIIAGERRYRAAKEAGLEEVQCLITDAKLSRDDLLEEQMIDNLHREDLDPIDQAKAYRRLMELRGWNATQLAENLHLSGTTVTKSLALLRLPEEVKSQVRAGTLPRAAAYEVAKLADPAQQREVAQQIVSRQLPGPAVAAVVRRKTGKARAEPGPTRKEYCVRSGTRVTVISKRRLTPAEIVDTLAEALRSAYEDSTPKKGGRNPQVSLTDMLEVLKSFVGQDSDLEFAVSGAMAVVAPLIVTQLLALLSHGDPKVRKQAGLAFNAIPLETRQAIAHLMPRKGKAD